MPLIPTNNLGLDYHDSSEYVAKRLRVVASMLPPGTEHHGYVLAGISTIERQKKELKEAYKLLHRYNLLTDRKLIPDD